ncbi:MAG: CAP domain-containing protein [Treponema sp.]|jgi:uncharacterized protein YkwD|nr:CAP domain-containing protein [Treponema sp.]
MKKFLGVVIVLYCSVVFSCESLEEGTDGMQEDGQTENTTAGQDNASAAANTPATANRNSPLVLNQYRRNDSSDPDWDIAALDTAKDINYLSSIEKSVILELNKVRADPRKYARLYIRPELQYYSGKFYRRPGQGRILTYEGIKAVEDCITALTNMESAPPLMPELGLSLGARDLAYEQERTGETGHEGSDNSTPFTRIRRYGGAYTAAAENLYYGAEQAREVVIQLLIDDGMSSRTQRANIMNRNFSQVGVSFGSHPQYKSVCVIMFADGYLSN